MSEYKRKKVHKTSNKRKTKIKEDNNIFFDDEDLEEKPKKTKKQLKKPLPKKKPPKTKRVVEKDEIKEEPEVLSDEETKRRTFRVIDKPNKAKRFFRSLIGFVLILVIIFGANYFLPGGLFESIKNAFVFLGSEDYPIEYNGSLLSDSVTMGSAKVLLNDNALTVFNKNGKEVYKHQHGFVNPVLAHSDSRIIVFDEGGDTLNLYSKSGFIRAINPGHEIINASVSRNGYVAVSCVGEGYTSTVYVYGKNGKKVYTWNSAKDLVNAVSISPNGKKIAVSCCNAKNGISASKLYVLEYKSADPVFSKDYNDNFIIAITSNISNFGCVTEDGYKSYSWFSYKEKSVTAKDKKLSMLRRDGNGTLLVFNRNNDRSDNKVILLSMFGGKKAEIQVDKNITDIECKGGRIYVISGTEVLIYNKKGEIVYSGECNYGVKRFYIISSKSIAVIMDDKIEKITL
ncbi:MAG: hypothetical protein IJJ40_05660 [Clostridia bacterium]|nr:hypothetical protein [Clostridia bacterium]